MRKKTYITSLETYIQIVLLLCSILLQNVPHSSNASTIYSNIPSDPNYTWSYGRVKRQIFREDIPHHRPLTGNFYAVHNGFPHPGRWHPNPQSILPPNPNSGHHFDDPNVIITDDDFNLYGSTLQHIDHEIASQQQLQPVLPLHHHPSPPTPLTHLRTQGQRKRRPIKILVHHHVLPTIHTKPVVHRYPIEYGKLIPLGEAAITDHHNVAINNNNNNEGTGIVDTQQILPIIAAAHHHRNIEQGNNPTLAYAQDYNHVAHEHEQKDPFPSGVVKTKQLYHQRPKFPPGTFNKYTNHHIPILKGAWPLRYGVHEERGKHGAFSWSIAY